MLIIGEKLNSTILPVREAIKSRDTNYIQDLACKQVAAGAHILDVNTAMGLENEKEDMIWLVQTVQSAVDVPLCIDATEASVIEKALQVHQGRAMINSISLEEKRIKETLPLVVEYDCSVVALTTDDEGIPVSTEGRLKLAEQLVEIAVHNKISLDDFYIDPLVMPMAVNDQNALIFFNCLSEIKKRYKVRTISGLSNVSYSLPLRKLINRSFLTIGMSLGMDAAILDPLDCKLMSTLAANNILLNEDKMCQAYLKAYRSGALVD
ncbi:MAG: dihydropteroate synthase [Desulfitobacteriaceae bacterium]|nr:dihydropteroate synthase [Desulfitobacteriaceae bacterium]